MRSTGIVRRLDRLGRIVLPKELRASFKIEYEDGLEIFTDDNRIILRKYMPACIFCGSREDIVTFKDKKVCAECMKALENQ